MFFKSIVSISLFAWWRHIGSIKIGSAWPVDLLVHYLRDLANEFHTYYNAHQFLVEDDVMRNARLNLILACRQVIANGLGLLGVSAPEAM